MNWFSNYYGSGQFQPKGTGNGGTYSYYDLSTPPGGYTLAFGEDRAEGVRPWDNGRPKSVYQLGNELRDGIEHSETPLHADEEEYTGPWGGIRFGPRSGPHFLKNTMITNAVTGLAVDSAAELNLDNVVVGLSAGSGLFARHAEVSAVNCLFYDNGTAGVALTFGGDYTFDYCTVASYGNDSEGLIINNFYCTDPLCSTGALVADINASLNNVIVADDTTTLECL